MTDEFRDRLRELIDHETMETTLEVVIHRRRSGRNGDATLPLTHVKETIRHPDEQHMASFNAKLESWVEHRPTPEQLADEMEVFAEHDAVLEERASGARFFAILDEPLADERELDLPAHLLGGDTRRAVEPVEPELEIPGFVHQPHPDFEPATPPRRRAS